MGSDVSVHAEPAWLLTRPGRLHTRTLVPAGRWDQGQDLRARQGAALTASPAFP